MFIDQNISNKFHPGPVISPNIGFKPGLHFLASIFCNRVDLTSNYKVSFNHSHAPLKYQATIKLVGTFCPLGQYYILLDIQLGKAVDLFFSLTGLLFLLAPT